jgi:DNA polymerase-3 subunit epsilon
MARAAFGIYPTRLDCVCQALGIPLVHHKAESDAEACARIVLAARAAPPNPPRRTVR